MNVASKLVPYYGLGGYDSLICNKTRRIFGVFDGIGISEGSRQAALYAKNYFSGMELLTYQDLRSDLLSIHSDLQSSPGGTTATVICIDSKGNIHYAHCGDSRLYVLLADKVRQVTADEGIENILYNHLGRGGHGCFQSGIILAEDWDKAMLCTDGVTGDQIPDLLTYQDIEIELKRSPLTAVEELILTSTKKDDKAIIVIER